MLLTSGLDPYPEATVKGHLTQEQQGLKSTTQNHQTTRKPFVKEEIGATLLDDAFPQYNVPNVKTNDVVYQIIDPRKMDKAYIDLAGQFPYMSRQGNQYILVGYHYDGNYIAATPLKRRTAGEITKS